MIQLLSHREDGGGVGWGGMGFSRGVPDRWSWEQRGHADRMGPAAAGHCRIQPIPDSPNACGKKTTPAHGSPDLLLEKSVWGKAQTQFSY